MTAHTFDEEYFEGGRSRYGSGGGYTKERFLSFHDSLVMAIVRSFKVRKTLDIGCAKGYLVEAFRRRNVQAYGVDISEYAISKCEVQTRPFLNVLDVQKQVFPFQNGTFDFITALEVFEHLEDFENVLRESRRVLRREGYLYVTTPKKGILKSEDLDKTHVSIKSFSSWLSLFRRYGFVKTRCPRDFPPRYSFPEALRGSLKHGVFILRAYLHKIGEDSGKIDSNPRSLKEERPLMEKVIWVGTEMARVFFGGSYRILLRRI